MRDGEYVNSMNVEDRFETDADAYAAYLKTVEGRLRLDLAWENLRVFVSGGVEIEGARTTGGPIPRALDLGGGTGALSVRLAGLGHEVALVDPSAAMLAIAGEAARQEAGAFDRLSFHQTDAAGAARHFAPRSFALAACHNVLEYVPDVPAVMRALGSLLGEGGLVSLLVRQRAGEVMRAALKAHDLE
ncbi:MAG: class I SAM-dependent methyltransferase, partial [Pyrinomonadaceae bacterium]